MLFNIYEGRIDSLNPNSDGYVGLESTKNRPRGNLWKRSIVLAIACVIVNVSIPIKTLSETN